MHSSTIKNSSQTSKGLIECDVCGTYIEYHMIIKRFSDGKILKVCSNCASYIRARNMEEYQ